jgi:signal peptidase I
MRESIKRFLWPRMNRRFALLLAIVAAAAFLLFGYVTRPFRVDGRSMEPTYSEGSLLLGSRFRYCWRDVRRGDVVFVMLAGPSVMYLKRVVGLPGDTVEFRGGALFVNGERQEEPWRRLPCDWNRKPQAVEPGFLFVVGDNRSVPIEQHELGVVQRKRIFGGPLW